MYLKGIKRLAKDLRKELNSIKCTCFPKAVEISVKPLGQLLSYNSS